MRGENPPRMQCTIHLSRGSRDRHDPRRLPITLQHVEMISELKIHRDVKKRLGRFTARETNARARV